jgi:hypothetical protein
LEDGRERTVDTMDMRQKSGKGQRHGEFHGKTQAESARGRVAQTVDSRRAKFEKPFERLCLAAAALVSKAVVRKGMVWYETCVRLHCGCCSTR